MPGAAAARAEARVRSWRSRHRAILEAPQARVGTSRIDQAPAPGAAPTRRQICASNYTPGHARRLAAYRDQGGSSPGPASYRRDLLVDARQLETILAGMT
jgi:hypothetical protein